MESCSLYIHIFSRSWSFVTYVEKSYGALKILKMACFKKEIYFFVLFLCISVARKQLFLFGFKISSVKVKNCDGGNKIINMATKVLIFKTLITSKLIDLATLNKKNNSL